MSDSVEPKNGSSPQGPDPRLAPVLRVVIEVRAGQVNVTGNAPPNVCINACMEGIVAFARIGMKPEEKSLVVPANGALPPPLRRLPRP